MNFKFTKVERNAIASMLGMGMTVRQAADALGLKYNQVYAFKYNRELNKVGRAEASAPVAEPGAVEAETGPDATVAEGKYNYRHRFTDAEKNAMTSMLEVGMNARQVADALGFKRKQVLNFKYNQKKRKTQLAAEHMAEAEPNPIVAEVKPDAAADSGNIIQIDLPMMSGERIVRVPIKLKLDISVA